MHRPLNLAAGSLLVLLAACSPMDSSRKDASRAPARQAPSAFDLELKSPSVRVLNRTERATASFDVVGATTIAAASGVGIEFDGYFFLLTAHHTFRSVGIPSTAIATLGRDVPPRISCVRQQNREFCPSSAPQLLALPDHDIAVVGPFDSSPTEEYLVLEESVFQNRELVSGHLMFSWSYPYSYGPSFSRSSYSFIQHGPLLREGIYLGSGKPVDTLYLLGWVSPGDSGSPLFSFAGRFVGIVNGGGSDRETGVGYVTAMPAWDFLPTLADLLRGQFTSDSVARR